MDHIPVLLEPAINFLSVTDDKIYVDCTFGAGGYTKKILESSTTAKVIAIDQDPSVKSIAQEFEKEFKRRFQFVNDNFGNLANILKEIGKVDGVVWDLGVSSMQLDEEDRGFSFNSNARLDMRMSCEGTSAYDFINFEDEKTIADVIYQYGDETKSRQIAKAIIEARKTSSITTCRELSDIIINVKEGRLKSTEYSRIHTATKTFQAIRICINNELNNFTKCLNELTPLLNENARVVFVSFHSLEDRIVKFFLKENSEKRTSISKYAKKDASQDTSKLFKILTPKPIGCSRLEMKNNHRARSAKLRAAMKL